MWLMMMVGAAVVFAWLCVVWRGRVVLIGESSLPRALFAAKSGTCFFLLKRFSL